MSTETIVNRVPETAGQAFERQKLEAAEVKAAETESQTDFDKGPGYSPAKPDAEAILSILQKHEGFDMKSETDTMGNPNPFLTPATASASRAAQTGDVTIFDTPEGQKVLDTLVEQAASELGFLAALDISNPRIRREEFDEFREKVVAAFKHLGLDTRKHFGS
ncbi:Uncharacterised protein [uncultured archaeon]|nr:Uncharacterised protein [uncultured archaeon]